MTTARIAGVLSTIALIAPAVAQEQGKPKKAQPVRAMRIMAAGAGGPPPSQKQLEERLATKMAEPFVKNAAWITDYDEARATSKETGRRLFAYFSRSYAP